jgi:hypothetical protein
MLAHRSRVPETYSELSVSWQEVNEAIDTIETVLKDLGLIGPRPDFRFFLERMTDLYPDEFHPEKPGVRLTQHFYFGIQEGETHILIFNKSFDRYAAGYKPPEDT